MNATIPPSLSPLRRSDLHPDPIVQFSEWFRAAENTGLPFPNAMTLATANRHGIPSARMVLLKGFDARGFRFFTNFESQKAHELAENPFAALVFYWQPLNRQVRIWGMASKIPADESDDYFRTRPRDNQISAWASEQSRRIENRAVLESRFEHFARKFGKRPVPRPPHWGGYVLKPSEFEFWQGQPNRLHDRFRYSPLTDGTWHIERLAP